jgi:hypothetical protein
MTLPIINSMRHPSPGYPSAVRRGAPPLPRLRRKLIRAFRNGFTRALLPCAAFLSFLTGCLERGPVEKGVPRSEAPGQPIVGDAKAFGIYQWN